MQDCYSLAHLRYPATNVIGLNLKQLTVNESRFMRLPQPCILPDMPVWLAASALQWIVYDPQGRKFPVVADAGEYADMIARIAGPDAVAQWKRLEAAMAPLQRGAALFPAAAIR